MDKTVTPTICRVCLRSCGILVHRTSKGIRIQGNPEHPVSRGFICFRGMHYGRIWGSDQRIKEPLIRKGNRWLKISYEDALSVVARKMEQSRKNYGAQSVAFLKGEALKHQEITAYMKHLCHAFGSPNFLSIGSLCQRAVAMGHALTYGGIPKFNSKRIKVAVLWGRNIAVSSVAVFKSFRRAVANGMKLIVIDPAVTGTAAIADLHLRVTPGSDGVLALAFIKAGIETYNRVPNPDQETGWDDLKTYLAGISMDDLLSRTGISEKEFSGAVQMMFENCPGWHQTGLGLELQPNGVQTIRTVACLQSLMDPGHFPESMAFDYPPLPASDRYPAMPEPVGHAQARLFVEHGNEGQAMFLDSAIRQNTPYPVKTMIVAGANPALTFPGASAQKKMFGHLDFMAVIELFMTRTARAADLVLPAADFLNSMEIHDYGRVGRPYLGLIRPIDQKSPGWPVWKWIFRLAEQLGLRAFFPWDNNEAALAYRLKGSCVRLDDLKNSPASVFPYLFDKNGKKPVGILSAGQGRTDQPRPDQGKKVNYFSKKADRAAGMGSLTMASLELPFTTDREYPFWLSTGDRVSSYQHSQFRESNIHLQQEPEPVVDIHPEAAGMLDIRNGDRVIVTTRYGRVRVKARMTDKVRRDCLRMLHGWEQANVNEVTGLEYFDPLSGFPWCRALPAQVTVHDRKQ